MRDLALWLQQATKPRRSPRTSSAGSVNPITRKRHLGDRYEPRTIGHNHAVVRSFYGFWDRAWCRPLINPVQLGRRHRAQRSHAHDLREGVKAEGQIRYNPKIPKRQPREIPDERWKVLFGGLRTNRDRAIGATAISNGARIGDLGV